MPHVISNYLTRIIQKTDLINEGTSVCFDQTNQDRLVFGEDLDKLIQAFENKINT